MNKVAYNRGFGGFHLSDEAIDRLEELGLVTTRYGNERLEKLGLVPTRYTRYENISRHDPRLIQVVVPTRYRRISRHDPRLIQVVEEGLCKDIEIAEISGNTYRIDEYDGWETVMEPEDYDWDIIE